MTNKKSKLKNLNPNQNKPDSIAGSMLSDVESLLGVKDLFGGKLVHLSFDCPINLREAFMQEIKDNKSSACKILQNSMLSYIIISRLKKHALGNTLSKVVDVPFTIENLNLNQYVQGRPRRRLDAVVEVGVGGGCLVDFYDLDAGGVWRKVEVDGDWDVNVNGHLVGCQCKVCRGLKHE